MTEIISSFVTIFSIGSVVLFLACLCIYTYFKLKRDVAKYKEIEDELQNSGEAPDIIHGEKGEDAPNGKNAYQVYLEGQYTYTQYLNDFYSGDQSVDRTEEYETYVMTHPTISKEEYFALFVGEDGEDGEDAEVALNGSHGSDGSTGHQGGVGFKGIPGEPGIAGQRGIPGEPFFTYHALTETQYLQQPDILNNFSSKAIIKNYLPNSAEIENYTIDGSLLTSSILINWETVTDGHDAYMSFLLYQNDKIIGFTEPVILKNLDPSQNITINVSPATPPIQFRAITSFFRGMVLSSFTANIYEKSLNNHSYIYQKPSNQDVYMAKFYNVLENNNSPFSIVENNYLEKIYMTKCETDGTSFSVDSFPIS